MGYTISRRGEHGNVLFLVLIAVILFAALSYAVTNTTRPQGTKSDGTTTIAAAELNQYPASLRVAIMTMRIDGVNSNGFEFNRPADFANLTSTSVGVFHPNGGGAPYQAAPPSVMAGNTQGQWHFNAEFEIENIGLGAAASFSGNDIAAFLPGVKQAVCESINDRVGISGGIPNSSADLSTGYLVDMENGYTLPASEIVLGAAGGNGTDSLTGQPFACFQNNGGEYVYYQVLAEQ